MDGEIEIDDRKRLQNGVSEVRSSSIRDGPRGQVVVNSSVLARALGLTTRRIEQLAKRGMPRQGHGKYPLRSCVRWYIRDVRDTADDWMTRKCLIRLQKQIGKMIDNIEHRRPLYKSKKVANPEKA
jgi:hypothetical protein